MQNMFPEVRREGRPVPGMTLPRIPTPTTQAGMRMHLKGAHSRCHIGTELTLAELVKLHDHMHEHDNTNHIH